MNAQYRDFGIYMTGYLEIQEGKYSTDQDEAINCMMTMQSEQEQRRDRRYRRYGKLDSDTGTQMDKTKILWKNEAIRSQSRNTRIQAINIQRGIRHTDDFLMRFGESRGER